MLNTPFAKTFMLLAVAAVIVAAFIYRATLPRFGVPDERLRVTHPAGFSMVQPRDWQPTQPELYFGDTAKEYRLGFFENRSEVIPAEIMVTRLIARPADLDTIASPETLLDRPAYRTKKERRRKSTETFWFEESGHWFQVAITVPKNAEPSDLFPYVATLRVETPAIQPATRPTTHDAAS